MAAKQQSWCFTNYELPSAESLVDLLKEHSVYGVFQKELCPTTQREHYQGFVRFTSCRTLTGVVKLCAMHWERRLPNSTDQAAYEYCEKEDSKLEGPWTWGNKPIWSKRGQRNDLLVVSRDIKLGKTLEEIADLYPCQFIKYHGGIGRLVEIQPVVKPVPHVQWYWGASGLGKTYYATSCPLIEVGLDLLFCPGGLPPQQGESEGAAGPSQITVGISNPPPRTFESYTTKMNRWIFDDYCEAHVKYEDLKRFIDRYAVTVPAMYRSYKFVPKEIVITCTYPPKHFWSGTKLQQIMRRVESVVKFEATK